MTDFIRENYEWLFSGIGVTFIVWLINWLKPKTRKIKNTDVIESLLKNKDAQLPPKYLTTVDNDGVEEKSEIILAFEFKDTKREYIVYTNHETDQYDNITIYVSEVDRTGGSPRLLGVPDGREWKRVREVLKELANAKEEQPLYDKDGIEII